MSLLARIAACRSWQPEDYLPLRLGADLVGLIKPPLAKRLLDLPGAFAGRAELGGGLAFARNEGPDDSSARLDEVVERLAEEGWCKLRRERYAIYDGARRRRLLSIDRGAVPLFGMEAEGVHLNGYVETPDGLALWIAKRAAHKPSAPGKLDQLAAGGQPEGLGLLENMVKEAGEECGMGAELAAGIRASGSLRYICERPEGLRRDRVFLFEVALPAGFAPRAADGEVESFRLLPLAEVRRLLEETEEFKFNCALVALQFLFARGVIAADEPGYAALLEALQATQASELAPFEG